MSARLALVAAAIGYAAVVPMFSAQSTPGLKSPEGQQIFRYDTFGDEQLWTDFLQLHTAIAEVSPATALDVGLQVDVEALPPALIEQLRAKAVDLEDPAVTLQLLQLDAVVGVRGRVVNGSLQSIGITCAFCHSVVDDSFAPSIGRRLDGWPNRKLNVGAIVALSPVLNDDQREVFTSWGPGKFDPRLQAFDGTQFIPLNSPTLPVVIPPAYGLRHLPFETFTADGPISYWNNYVGVSQMGGHGSFSDPRIGLTIVQTPDLVTPKLRALRDYQLGLHAPRPPRGSFDRAAAGRGAALFHGAAGCATCHRPPAFTDVRIPGSDEPRLHAPEETGMESVYATRSATFATDPTNSGYRTSPLRGIWQHPPYFHDGSAADLDAVVRHYNGVRRLGLSAEQQADLVEFLKSL